MATMNVFARHAGERVEVIDDEHRLVITINIYNVNKGMEGNYVVPHADRESYDARINEIGVELSTRRFALQETYEVELED